MRFGTKPKGRMQMVSRQALHEACIACRPTLAGVESTSMLSLYKHHANQNYRLC